MLGLLIFQSNFPSHCLSSQTFLAFPAEWGALLENASGKGLWLPALGEGREVAGMLKDLLCMGQTHTMKNRPPVMPVTPPLKASIKMSALPLSAPPLLIVTSSWTALPPGCTDSDVPYPLSPSSSPFSSTERPLVSPAPRPLLLPCLNSLTTVPQGSRRYLLWVVGMCAFSLLLYISGVQDTYVIQHSFPFSLLSLNKPNTPGS